MKKTLSMMVVVLLVATGTAQAAHISLLSTKDVTAFSHTYTGAEIYDSTGAGYQNGWTGGASAANFTLTTTGTVLNLTTTGTTQTLILNGTNSTDGGAATWLSGVNDDFTVEMTVKVNSAPKGVRLWMGNDNERIFLSIYADKIVTTNNGGGLKNVAVDMTSGFRTIRVASDGGAGNSDVHVWIDGTAVSDPNGGVYNQGDNDNRLLFGDSTSADDFDSFNVDIAALSYDTVGAFAPIPEPGTMALLVLGGLGVLRKRRR